MRNIPNEALDAIAEGMDEENARPENNTPTARARRALRAGPFENVGGPNLVAARGEPAALFGTRRALVVTRHVTAKKATPEVAQSIVDAVMDAARIPTDLRALYRWLDNFDGDVPVRVFGVPLDANVLHSVFAAFPAAPDRGTYAIAKVPGVVDGAACEVSLLVIEHDGVTVGVIGFSDAKDCVAAWPIPAGVRE